MNDKRFFLLRLSRQCQKHRPRSRTEGGRKAVEGITKEESQELIKKYGQDNWYEWAHQNWGTKWGAYDNEMDGDTYRFTTAWCPVSLNILEMLSKIIPNFTFEWELDSKFIFNLELYY